MDNHLIATDTVLEDDRVLMRLLTTNDLGNLMPFAINEPGIWKYSLISGATAAGMEKYIRIAAAGHKAGHSFPFIVFDKKNNAWAGSSRFYDIQPEHQMLQLGYTWYGSQFQGTGLNRHCKFLLLQFAFEKLGMERVEFRADNDNARSIAAMITIGCKVDGILRNNMPKPAGEPGRRSSIVLSILKEEWYREVKDLLIKSLINN